MSTTGKLNISLEAGRSEELYELIQVSVAFGASIVCNNKNTTTFEEIFPRPSRDEFRIIFISMANEMWRYCNYNCSLKFRECINTKSKYIWIWLRIIMIMMHAFVFIYNFIFSFSFLFLICYFLFIGEAPLAQRT